MPGLPAILGCSVFAELHFQIVKPQDPVYSFNTTFTYQGGKLICEDNEAIQDEVDRKLNLNHQTLIKFRNITLSQFIKSLNGNNTKEIFEDQLKR